MKGEYIFISVNVYCLRAKVVTKMVIDKYNIYYIAFNKTIKRDVLDYIKFH